jgi:hypothetical protein
MKSPECFQFFQGPQLFFLPLLGLVSEITRGKQLGGFFVIFCGHDALTGFRARAEHSGLRPARLAPLARIIKFRHCLVEGAAGLSVFVFNHAIDGETVRSLELFQSIEDGLGFVLDENGRMGFWREPQILEHAVWAEQEIIVTQIGPVKVCPEWGQADAPTCDCGHSVCLLLSLYLAWYIVITTDEVMRQVAIIHLAVILASGASGSLWAAEKAVPPFTDEKIAALNDIQLFVFGWDYAEGRGVAQNLDLAKQLFEAAFKRDPGHAIGIGHVYERGLKDFAKASHWYERGAALGVKNAVDFFGFFTNRRRSIRFPTLRVLRACANRVTVSAPSVLATCIFMAGT